ncbi:MAG: hypothetical protein GQ533_00945 [Methanosarcinaceae archaeon]|nr:hypothetical protein [Methanosarcinaceae archaeon]
MGYISITLRILQGNLRSSVFICGLINNIKIIFIQSYLPPAANPTPPAAACTQNNRAQAVGCCIQAQKSRIYCAASPARTASAPSSTDQPLSQGSPGFGVAGALLGIALVVMARRS